MYSYNALRLLYITSDSICLVQGNLKNVVCLFDESQCEFTFDVFTVRHCTVYTRAL